MKGLLYKEIVQNKFCYILCFLIPILGSGFLFYILGKDVDTGAYSIQNCAELFETNGAIVRFVFYTFIFIIVDLLLTKPLDNDEMKKWAYFICSSPKMPKGQVYSKYLSVFIMICIMSVSYFLTDMIMCSVLGAFSGLEMSCFAIFAVCFFYLELFIKAVEIPFSVRFGSKHGSYVKVAFLVIIFIAVFIYFLFGPLPMDEEDLIGALVEFVQNLKNGKYADIITFVSGLLPFVSAGLYVASYFISCKLYLKGVECYDK